MIDLNAIEKAIEGNHPSSYELIRTSALAVLIEIAKAAKEARHFESDDNESFKRLDAALAQIKGPHMPKNHAPESEIRAVEAKAEDD